MYECFKNILVNLYVIFFFLTTDILVSVSLYVLICINLMDDDIKYIFCG